MTTITIISLLLLLYICCSSHMIRAGSLSIYPAFQRVSRLYQRQTLSSLNMDANNMKFYELESVGSTQDEARRILRELNPSQSILFTVSAREQNKGRGTSGRQWIGHRGNSFFTVTIPMNLIKVPVTLVPLKIGCIIAQTIQEQLNSEPFRLRYKQDPALVPKVSVKWPNDVLVDERKISGVLIETETCPGPPMTSWLLIGIGINVASTPKVASVGENRGREATSIKDCIVQMTPSSIHENQDEYFIQLSTHFSKIISRKICIWLDSQQELISDDDISINRAVDSIIQQWESMADLGKPLLLRDVEGNQKVVPLSLAPDGRLRVINSEGEIRLLSSDYLL